MAEEMGPENMFIFGMTVDEVELLKRKGYNAYTYYESIPALKQCVDQIQNGYFSPNNPDEFKDIVDILLKWDRYCYYCFRISFNSSARLMFILLGQSRKTRARVFVCVCMRGRGRFYDENGPLSRVSFAHLSATSRQRHVEKPNPKKNEFSERSRFISSYVY